MLFLIYILFLINLTSSKSPNIILFLTDDQDLLLGGLTPMKRTLSFISNQGITFQNAFVNAPICCPSRSSLLSGRFPHNTEVKNNSIEGNCAGEKWQKNIERTTIAVSLSEAGYINFYAGKYLNRYGSKENGGAEHIPKGWHWWNGLIGNSKYYDYSLSENGTENHYGNDSIDYLTDVITSKAIDFLNQNSIKQHPFFMVLAPPTPHAPFTPAERHLGMFPNVKALRTASFNYTPAKKHWLLQMPPIHLPSNVFNLDQIQEHRFETLMAVDDMVESIIEKLTDIKEIDNTYIIFTSDNGFHIGQFGQPWDKRQPYDTDIRVPLLIRGPKIKKKTISKLPVQSVDLAPTILEMAGLNTPVYMDGKSFLSDMKLEQLGKFVNMEKNILIEYHGEGNSETNDPSCPWSYSDDLSQCGFDSWCKCQDARNNTYNCVRQLSTKKDFLYCEFFDDQNFREAYNLSEDMYQLKNIYTKMSDRDITKYSTILKKLLNCKGKNCFDI